MCCYGNIHRRPDGKNANHKCCLDSSGAMAVFNKRFSISCNGVVNERPTGRREYHKCCQTVAFNNRWSSCRNGVVVSNDNRQVEQAVDDPVAAPADIPVDGAPVDAPADASVVA